MLPVLKVACPQIRLSSNSPVLKFACPQSRLSLKLSVLKVACPQCRVLNVAVLNVDVLNIAVLNVACPQCPIGPPLVLFVKSFRFLPQILHQNKNAIKQRK